MNGWKAGRRSTSPGGRNFMAGSSSSGRMSSSRAPKPSISSKPQFKGSARATPSSTLGPAVAPSRSRWRSKRKRACARPIFLFRLYRSRSTMRSDWPPPSLLWPAIWHPASPRVRLTRWSRTLPTCLARTSRSCNARSAISSRISRSSPAPPVWRFTKRLIRQARIALKPGGWLLLELGYNSLEPVREMLQSGWRDIEARSDLAGLPRVLEARLCG